MHLNVGTNILSYFSDINMTSIWVTEGLIRLWPEWWYNYNLCKHELKQFKPFHHFTFSLSEEHYSKEKGMNLLQALLRVLFQFFITMKCKGQEKGCGETTNSLLHFLIGCAPYGLRSRKAAWFLQKVSHSVPEAGV